MGIERPASSSRIVYPKCQMLSEGLKPTVYRVSVCCYYNKPNVLLDYKSENPPPPPHHLSTTTPHKKNGGRVSKKSFLLYFRWGPPYAAPQVDISTGSESRDVAASCALLCCSCFTHLCFCANKIILEHRRWALFVFIPEQPPTTSEPSSQDLWKIILSCISVWTSYQYRIDILFHFIYLSVYY